jgi:hypothetical protein
MELERTRETSGRSTVYTGVSGPKTSCTEEPMCTTGSLSFNGSSHSPRPNLGLHHCVLAYLNEGVHQEKRGKIISIPTFERVLAHLCLGDYDGPDSVPREIQTPQKNADNYQQHSGATGALDDRISVERIEETLVVITAAADNRSFTRDCGIVRAKRVAGID